METKKQDDLYKRRKHLTLSKADELFKTEVLNVLSEDASQTCIDATGTQIRILKDVITIEGDISGHTLRELINLGYLTSCNEKGQVEINAFKMGGGE